MNLYLVHCGFYDASVCDGIYESHANFFVVAESFEDARAKAKTLPDFQSRKMHVDGLQEVRMVNGYKVQLQADGLRAHQTEIVNFKHREVAPKPASQAGNGDV
jgi:hypothetical protein